MIDSVEKYRVFDLVLLSVLAVGAEFISEFMLAKYSGAGFYLSFSILVAIIAMIRWGWWGSIVYIVAGIPMVFLHAGSMLESILLYPISYMFIVLSSFFFRILNRDKVAENYFYLLGFTLISYISVSIGKGIAHLFLTGAFVQGALYYFVSQLFNMVMVCVVLLPLKRKEGLLVDMEQYLLKGQNVNEKNL